MLCSVFLPLLPGTGACTDLAQALLSALPLPLCPQHWAQGCSRSSTSAEEGTVYKLGRVKNVRSLQDHGEQQPCCAHLPDFHLPAPRVSPEAPAGICCPLSPADRAVQGALAALARTCSLQLTSCARRCCAHKEHAGAWVGSPQNYPCASLAAEPCLCCTAGCACLALRALKPLLPLSQLACWDRDGWAMENNPLIRVGLFTFTVRPLQHLLRWCAELCPERGNASAERTLTGDSRARHRFTAESCWNCLCLWGSSAYGCCLVCED